MTAGEVGGRAPGPPLQKDRLPAAPDLVLPAGVDGLVVSKELPRLFGQRDRPQSGIAARKLNGPGDRRRQLALVPTIPGLGADFPQQD